jgi:hypothetical protein
VCGNHHHHFSHLQVAIWPLFTIASAFEREFRENIRGELEWENPLNKFNFKTPFVKM